MKRTTTITNAAATITSTKTFTTATKRRYCRQKNVHPYFSRFVSD